MIDAPTATTFKTRFPEFGPVSDDLVELVILEAVDAVGDNWLERDRTLARLLLTAHNLSMEGEPARSKSLAKGGAVQNAQSGPVTSFKDGDVAVTFGGTGSGASGTGSAEIEFGKTSYGARYLVLMRKNFPTAFAV